MNLPLATVVLALAVTAGTVPALAHAQEQEEESPSDDESRITDEVIPLATDLPARPAPIIELGPPFLGSGNIGPGIRAPGGAVWQPSFILFGTLRTSAGLLDDERVRTRQWTNRLDLFGNLYLTPTERLVVGLRPFDEATADGDRSFTGYTSMHPDPGGRSGFQEHLNLGLDTIETFFFEGDVQELLPFLDRDDTEPLDLGLSVGRQAVVFQEGLLLNDTLDAVGFTRNNLKPSGTSNLRLTGLFAWGGVNRHVDAAGGLPRKRSAAGRLAGLFAEVDWSATTMEADLIWVSRARLEDPGEGADTTASGSVHAGLGFVQRIGSLNTAFRLLASTPVGSAPDVSIPSRRGALMFTEMSWTPKGSHDLQYFNGFAALGSYRAAALDPTVSGPLARAGILFAGAGIGSFGAPLAPEATDTVGLAAGRQIFFASDRAQAVIEAAARFATASCATTDPSCAAHGLAVGARLQRALGRRFVVVADTFVAIDRLRRPDDAGSEPASRFRNGLRVELLVKF